MILPRQILPLKAKFKEEEEEEEERGEAWQRRQIVSTL
jgi:hypothetical protein